MPPTLRFGKFTISGLLGPGGLTETYLAHLPEDADRLFALKLLRADRFGPDSLPEARGLFVAAGKRIQGLVRPGIGRVVDIVEDPSTTFIVSEHIPGNDLVRLLTLAKTEGRADCPGMDSTFAGLICAEVARVLALAHQSKPCMPHLGLAPGNVLIGADGEVSIFDFGIAASVRGLAEEPIHRFTHVAPELFSTQLGRRSLPERQGVAADLYSLGSVLFELLSGAPLASGESLDQLLEAKRKAKPSVPGIPSQVQAALRAMLALEWEERPASATAVVEWLSQGVASASERKRLIGKGIATLEKGVPAISREIPLDPELVAGASVSPSVLPTSNAVTPRSPEPIRQALRLPPTRRRIWPWILGVGTLVVAGSIVGVVMTTPSTPPSMESTSVAKGARAVDPETAPRAVEKPRPVPTLDKPVEEVTKLPKVEGHLVVDTDPPGATVWVDGIEKGKTFLDVVLGEGGHRIVVIAPGHRMFREVVDSTPGVIIRRSLTPIEAPTKGDGMVKVDCKTHGKFPILIDDEETGLLCPARAIPLPAGKHTVSLYLPPTRKTIAVDVQITAGGEPVLARFAE